MRSIHPLAALALAITLCTSAACTPEGASADAAPAERSAGTEPAAAPLTDAQIAHVAVTANAIDVELAELADSRSSHDEVRAFAQTMIRDHTAVNERAAALAGRLGVTPEDNPVSQSLRSGAEEARTQLSALTGEAFDRAYIQREVEYHQAVLDALDQTLIPGTSNEELRGLLQEVRPAIAAHLEHARSLAKGLQASR